MQLAVLSKLTHLNRLATFITVDLTRVSILRKSEEMRMETALPGSRTGVS